MTEPTGGTGSIPSEDLAELGLHRQGGEVSLPSAQLSRLGITLPPVATPLASYVPATRIGDQGDQVWTSGQLPLVAGELVASGKVGAEVGLEQAAEAARAAVLNALAAVAAEADGIDSIRRILKVVVYVASDPGFTEQHKVANGASELIGEVFGEVSGAHVRSAVGVAVLPMDAPVEIELLAEI